MRNSLRRIAGALLVALVGLGAHSAAAIAGGRAAAAGPADDVMQDSVLRIPANASFPLVKRISLGESKSVLIQFGLDIKDVLVADPEKLDAVVHTSNRIFLIAKKTGQTNAFFFGAQGQQLLTLEVNVGADLKGLDGVLKRFVPGSRIQVEMAGRAAVLTGFVRTPLDAKRAVDIACQFVGANRSVGNLSPTAAPTANAAGGAVSQGSYQSNATYESKTQQQAAACAGETKLVINLLNVEGEEQVMLKVMVAEVQRTILKQMGVNLGAIINSGNFSTALLTANQLPLTAAAGLGSLPVVGIPTSPVGLPALYNAGPIGAGAPYGNSGADGTWTSGQNRIQGALRAMERDGLIRTLAEPNLTAVSGETAKFLAGGEYPVPIVDSLGKLSVTFKEFGIGVAFTPIVMSEGRISLRITTEVSELTDAGAVTLAGITIPALKKRQANSTVELPSGGSLAIAGLISDDTRQNFDGLPGMKDLPVLGALFRSRDFTKKETELVVIVTPYIVRPTSRQNLASPDDGLAPASDLKANFLGHLNRVYGGGRELPSGGLKGDYGFIVE